MGTRGTRLDINRQIDAVPRQYLSTLPYRDTAVNNRLTAQVSNPFFPTLTGTDIGGRTVARSQLLRPYPQFPGITVADPEGFSWYHSLQVRVERRMRAGFTLGGNYTWSKFMEATSYLNNTDPGPEKVISDQDRAHRGVVNGIWELPFGPRRRFGSSWRGPLAAAFGGWQVSAVFQAQSGAPLAFGNILFYGDIHDIPLPAGERGPDRWFNTDAGFEKDTGKQLVNNVRTFPSRLSNVRGKGLNMWNVSALKNFRVAERVRFQLRTEWLNATNHTHLNNPTMGPTNTLFGTITGTGAYPRQIYFAGKLLW